MDTIAIVFHIRKHSLDQDSAVFSKVCCLTRKLKGLKQFLTFLVSMMGRIKRFIDCKVICMEWKYFLLQKYFNNCLRTLEKNKNMKLFDLSFINTQFSSNIYYDISFNLSRYSLSRGNFKQRTR